MVSNYRNNFWQPYYLVNFHSCCTNRSQYFYCCTNQSTALYVHDKHIVSSRIFAFMDSLAFEASTTAVEFQASYERM